MIFNVYTLKFRHATLEIFSHLINNCCMNFAFDLCREEHALLLFPLEFKNEGLIAVITTLLCQQNKLVTTRNKDNFSILNTSFIISCTYGCEQQIQKFMTLSFYEVNYKAFFFHVQECQLQVIIHNDCNYINLPPGNHKISIFCTKNY